MFVDLRCTQGLTVNLPHKARRKLNSKNPRLVKAYLTIVNKKVRGQNIEAQMAVLENKDRMGENDILELLLIDDTLMSILMGDEARIQPQRTQDSFSVRMNELKRSRHYWRKILHLTKASTHFSLKKYLPMHVNSNIRSPKLTIKNKIRATSKRIEEFRIEGHLRREEMLTEMIRHEKGKQETEAAEI